MMLPDELEWVLEMLGYRWPTADEDKLRDCAEVWRKFGEKVTELHGTANGAARQVTAHNAGESIDKFVKTYEKFDGGGGGDGYLRNAAEAAFLIANVLEACSPSACPRSPVSAPPRSPGSSSVASSTS